MSINVLSRDLKHSLLGLMSLSGLGANVVNFIVITRIYSQFSKHVPDTNLDHIKPQNKNRKH